MLSYACAACGKSITETALQQGTAVHHSGRVYCASCASLIVTPGSMPIVGEDVQEPVVGEDVQEGGVEVLSAEYKISIHAPDIPSPFAVEQTAEDVLQSDNSDLIQGVGSDMAHNDDDDWFKPRNSGGAVGTADAGSAPRISVKPAIAPSTPAPAPVRPAAKASGVSSRVGMPPAKKVAPSARMVAVAPPEPVEQPEVAEVAPVVEPRKSGRTSAVKSGIKPSTSGIRSGATTSGIRGGATSRKISAVRAPAVAKPEPEASVAEVTDEPEAEVVASPSRGKSSRRMPAAKSSSRSSASASRSRRSEREEERDEKKDKKKGGKKDDKMPIYIGVGVVAVLLIGAFVMMGKNGGDEAPTGKPAAEAVDKTPSAEYARQAQQELSSGSRSKAIELYSKAAAQAEREGNTGQARRYGMQQVELIKTSKRNDH